MPEWIFTFGFHHVHPETGERLRMKFVRIKAANDMDARFKMIERFGRQWAIQYPSETAAGVQQYGLTELTDEKS